MPEHPVSQTGDLWVLGRHRLLCGDSTAQAVDLSPRDADETAWLRHEFRTPLNAIKGYGELLVEEICESGRDTLLTDLGKVLDLADRLLGEIDRVAGNRRGVADRHRRQRVTDDKASR